MSATQKFAWFNLAVIGIALAAAGALFPFLGKATFGCFGLLGLMGLGPLFFRGKAGQVVADERDLLIHQRAWTIAYSLFWVVFVLAATLLSPLIYGQDGAVPVVIVQGGVAVGFMLVYVIGSIAILMQYAGDSRDANQVG